MKREPKNERGGRGRRMKETDEKDKCTKPALIVRVY